MEEIRQAFNEVGATLAEIAGMSGTAPGNVLIGSSYYVGVFSPATVDRVMMQEGGYRNRQLVQLLITRDRMPFAAIPKDNTTLTRVDVLPLITYRIEKGLTHDPIHWVFNLIDVRAP